MSDQLKVGVTVNEMARMTGLSRSRFYQLIGTTFPEPSRDGSGRPFYSEEQQRVCLEVRSRNCGVDGRMILFCIRRRTTKAVVIRQHAKPKQAPVSEHAEITASVQALGLTTATAAQVGDVIRQTYPNGVAGIDPGVVIRTVFLGIKQQQDKSKSQ
jgi:hypothetical protein